MKTSSALLFATIALLMLAPPRISNAQTQHSLRVQAYIDGSDYLCIRGNKVWYRHVDWELPGKGGDHDYPTYLDDDAWYPTWNGSGVSARHSLSAEAFLPTNVASSVFLENHSARCVISISSQPSFANDYTLELYLSDSASGAEWCDFTISFLTTQITSTLPTISNVTAQQRYPWNGKVDITYTVSGIDDLETVKKEYGLLALNLKVSAIDCDSGVTNVATALSGDTALTNGTHCIVWDMDVDGLTFKSTNVVFSVSCETTPATYFVIDLSAGANASSYPVAYLAEPPSGGFNVDAYKTTKLVLKRIESGSFKMGGSTQTTLSKPFLIGLFEVTQKQYSLVTGGNPSNFSGNKKPVEKVNYNAIRGSSDGTGWPSVSAVDPDSFMGKLRARTGLDFDLPTEAQWEYACRAGTTTKYSYGDSADGNYMWYSSNSSSQTHDVGTKQSNPWGLYDMHGNVWEWCLDWYERNLSGGTDPKGSSSGSNRVRRGGSWNLSNCTSSYRDYVSPSLADYRCGFRLARTLNK